MFNFTLSRYQQCLVKVQKLADEAPEHKLNEAERFLWTLGQPRHRLLESLSLWKFRSDCEAMEREICEPLRCLSLPLSLSLSLSSPWRKTDNLILKGFEKRSGSSEGQ